MIRFRALGVDFCLPLLALAAPLLALRLGAPGGLLPLALALCAHELAHLLAARLTRVDISEIRLTPFGGSARIENPYRLSAAQLIATAAAGPAANLLLAILLAALAQWGALAPGRAAQLIRPNLLLMLFNLLPALPLDGGRILYALLRAPLGERRALTCALLPGRLLAALLLAAFLTGGLRTGAWNLTLPLAAVFLLASGRDESGALDAARAGALADAMAAPSAPRPARIYQLDAATPARGALALLHPREQTWLVLTANGAPTSLLDAAAVVRHLASGAAPDAPLSALPAYRLARAE